EPETCESELRGPRVPNLSPVVSELKPSGTAESAAVVAKLLREGVDVVDLTTGEPDWQPPPHAQDALLAAMHAGHNKYTPASGSRELREAVVEKFRRENGTDASLENVIVTSGAKQLIFNAFFSMLSAGDEAIITSPYWTSFP